MATIGTQTSRIGSRRRGARSERSVLGTNGRSVISMLDNLAGVAALRAACLPANPQGSEQDSRPLNLGARRLDPKQQTIEFGSRMFELCVPIQCRFPLRFLRHGAAFQFRERRFWSIPFI